MMKHLTNIYDPKRPDAENMIIALRGQTRAEAWHAQQQWLSDKMIGSPKATDQYSIRELATMGFVGVYAFPFTTEQLQAAVGRHAEELP